jgi:hypothetical protein
MVAYTMVVAPLVFNPPYRVVGWQHHQDAPDCDPEEDLKALCCHAREGFRIPGPRFQKWQSKVTTLNL